MFGNSVMLQFDKLKISKLVVMLESELILAANKLLPERERSDKDFREEKSLKSIG